jgi:hypothetical protein
MKRWFHAVALTAVLTPLAICREGAEAASPQDEKCSPPACCAKKKDKAEAPAALSADKAGNVPEDERQAYQELMAIICTTKSPDTFMAAVAALLGADGPVEKRYARLAVPVVIRNAERLGVLNGLASSEQLTPAQEELLDYLEGAAALSAQGVAGDSGISLTRRPYGTPLANGRGEQLAPPKMLPTGREMDLMPPLRNSAADVLPMPTDKAAPAPTEMPLPPQVYDAPGLR